MNWTGIANTMSNGIYTYNILRNVMEETLPVTTVITVVTATLTVHIRSEMKKGG